MQKIKHIISCLSTPGAYIPDIITILKECLSIWFKKKKTPGKIHSKSVKLINKTLINISQKWANYYFSRLSKKLTGYDGVWSSPLNNAPLNECVLGENVSKESGNFKTILLLPSEKRAIEYGTNNPEYNNKQIAYTLDKNNYRVYKSTKAKKIIACFGCSNTFGEGLPDEETWPYIFQEKFKPDEYSVFNYGACGVSSDYMCRTIHTYLKENTPDGVICLFPDLFRNEFYDIQNKQVITMSPFISYKSMNIEKEYESYNLLYNDVTGFLNFVKNFNFIDLMCKSKKIPFLWHTWSPTLLNLDLNTIYKFIGIRSDCPVKGDRLYNIVNEYKLHNLEDKARDGYHNGKRYNEALVAEFLKLINKI